VRIRRYISAMLTSIEERARPRKLLGATPPSNFSCHTQVTTGSHDERLTVFKRRLVWHLTGSALAQPHGGDLPCMA
jgi:hypothetical protein